MANRRLVLTLITMTSMIAGILSLSACNSPTINPMDTPTSMGWLVSDLTPTPYPTIDPAVLPGRLKDLLARYSTFEELNEHVRVDFHWSDLPLKGFASPAVSLIEEKEGDCSESAMISALFGEKFGYYPYQLIMTFNEENKVIKGHATYVFRDPATGKWGYNDNLSEYQPPEFESVEQLAYEFILLHPVAGDRYDHWFLIDLNSIEKVKDIAMDWRTTSQQIPINEDLIVASGDFTQ